MNIFNSNPHATAMPRSNKRTITIPNPIREGLLAQIQDGTLDYPSENAAWIGLARYQLIVGKPHAITVAIARMHADDHDCIDDFLLEVASRGLSLRGQFLAHLVKEAVSGADSPGEQEVGGLIPSELLRIAKAWKKGPEKVLAGLR
ncbi:MAG: hypothetical protein DVB23_002091 [Verrucomicrobia bacterium]|nr:MAG: hypothetical protein DVB23_002091 [Verrucomicrobiota bacterium]